MSILPYYQAEVELYFASICELSDTLSGVPTLLKISRFTLEYAVSLAFSLTIDSTKGLLESCLGAIGGPHRLGVRRAPVS